MKEIKCCRMYKDKFTVVLSFEDYGAFAYDGLFPTERRYYKIDTEEEMLNEFNKEECLFAEDVNCIYYDSEDVTEKYLQLADGVGYQLADCWRAN